MNLFFLDPDVDTCAKYHVDRHCVKIILEAAQCLCTAYPKGIAPYRHTHYNHPMAQWIRANRGNFQYALDYAWALCREYSYRYGKKHKTETVLKWIESNKPPIPDGSKTEPPRCFGNYKDFIPISDNVYEDYRKYYKLAKSHLFSWKNRGAPNWIYV